MTTHAQHRAVTERRQLDNVVLNAAIVGAVDTSVLRWNVAATANQGLGGWPAVAWVTEANTANNGTTLKISRRGMYHAVLGLTLEASNDVGAGISLDAPAATLLDTAIPNNSTAGILLGQEQITPAATQSPFNLEVSIPISDRQAGGTGLGIVRFHATGLGEAGPAAGITLATARYRLTYVGDTMGS